MMGTIFHLAWPTMLEEALQCIVTYAGTNCITHKTIENYISKHDETGEIMKTYLKLKNEEAGEKLHKTTFFQITKWFFETYPELKTVA